MAIQTTLRELFEHSGINAEDSQGNLQENEFNLLENIELSDNRTLKKRKGFNQEGDKQSTNEIKYLDRYIDGAVKFLLKSEAGKLYYENLSPGVTSPVRIRETLTSAANYSSTDSTIELTLSGTHPFLEEDNIQVEIDGTTYYWFVSEVISATEIEVYGVLSDISGAVAGTEVVYASRTSEDIPVEDGSNFAVNDMIVLDTYNRPFKITAIDTNTLTIDDTIYFSDASVDSDVTVYSRWDQFTESDGNIQKDVPFDSNSGVDKISSSMLNRSIIMSNGEDEPLVFDGVDAYRLGFHELPDMLNSDYNAGGDTDLWYNLWLEGSGNLDAGVYKYKMTYSVYDNNGNRHESGTSSVRQVKLTGTNNVLIPVFTIPYSFNKNLMYDTDKCVVTAWRTEADGVTSYYRSVEVPMNQLGSFQIASIEKDDTAYTADFTNGSATVANVSDISKFYVGQVVDDGSTNITVGSVVTSINVSGNSFTMDNNATGTQVGASFAICRAKLTIDGSPDLSNLILGDYMLIKGAKASNNNDIGVIDEVDNTSKYIWVSIYNATDDTTGTSLRGNATVCIRDNVNDYELINNELLYTNDNAQSVNDAPPIAKYITTWDNKVWAANGKTYQEMYLNLDLTVSASSPFTDGDLIYLTDGTTTETYEIKTGATDASDGTIRIDCQNVDDLYTQIKVICETINSKPDGLVWAYYENTSDAGGILLRERQRGANLQFKIDLNTTSTLTSIKIDSTWLAASDNDTYFDFNQDEYSSRVWWTKEGTPGAFVGTFLSNVTDEVQYKDIAKNDGQEVTGIMPLSTLLLVFKERSLYRIIKTSSGYDFELVDGEVGTKSPKSIAVVGNKALFLSEKGVYATDGFSVKFIGKKVNQYWKKMSKDYLEEACGTHHIERHQYWVCYVDNSVDSTQSTNNRVMVYDYLNDAWFTFTGIEATMFTKIDTDLYYSTYDGLVYKRRDYNHKSDYRDDASAITATIVTPWYSLGTKTSRKMFTYLTVHGYLSDTSNRGMNIYYATDMNNNYYDLETVNLYVSPWGHFPFGTRPWGRLILQPSRQPVSPQKCTYGRFKFENSGLDEALEILGFSIEGKIIGVEGVKQPI